MDITLHYNTYIYIYIYNLTFSLRVIIDKSVFVITGIKGLEPLNERTKSDGLTIWLYPKY